MPVTIYCPFAKTDMLSKRGALRMCCESARIDFAGIEERQKFLSRYCASEKGWKGCTIAILTERRYENE